MQLSSWLYPKPSHRLRLTVTQSPRLRLTQLLILFVFSQPPTRHRHAGVNWHKMATKRALIHVAVREFIAISANYVVGRPLCISSSLPIPHHRPIPTTTTVSTREPANIHVEK